MFTDGRNIEKSYSLNYQCHKKHELQNITAYFTFLKTESKICFILGMHTKKAILSRNQPRMFNFCSFPGQFMSAKPNLLGHDLLVKCPGFAREDNDAWN